MIGFSTLGLPRPVGSEFRQRSLYAQPRRRDHRVPWIVSVVDTPAGRFIEAKNHIEPERIVAAPIEGHSEPFYQDVLAEAMNVIDDDGWQRLTVQACDVNGCQNPLPMWVGGRASPHEIRECLACEARTVLACQECGAPDAAQYIGDVRERLLRDQLCHSCGLWTDRIAKGVEVLDQEWRMHSVGPGRGRKEHRGYGGAGWVIEFTDGRRVETDDLWYGGVVPEWFRDRCTPNATLTRAVPS